MTRRNKKTGCGCLNFLFFIIILGIGYGWLNRNNYLNLSQFFPNPRNAGNTVIETMPIFTPPSSPSPLITPSPFTTFPYPKTVPQGMVINVGGSTSMVQINQGIKQSFQQTFLGTTINLSAQGSDKGIEALLRGEIQISAISRPLSGAEKQQGLRAIPITQDAIAIIVSINNPFRRGLTQQSVQDIFTGNITNWQQIGGINQPIKIVNRPFVSGTRKVFQKDVLKGNYFGNTLNFITLDQDSTTAILQSLNNDGISYATYSQVRDQLTTRVVPVDGLIPESALYPYQRTLYYAYKSPASPSVQAFLGYVTSPQGTQIIEASKFVRNKPPVPQKIPEKSVNSPWLDWLIDEAHKQGMEVHAYFEKGIKIDQNSPIFQKAIEQKWLVPGVDKTYTGVDHYVLDVEVPEVANFFREIVVEFVQKYPQIDAVQWDDYLGYHAELPGQVDRTAKLTQFIQQMITAMKQANPSVSFDLCHHNPYWAKRYFAADWKNWAVDRVFIQAYNEKNFKEELNYAQSYAGIAITSQQFHRLDEVINNPRVKSVLIFPLDGNPEKTASQFNQVLSN